MHKKLLFSLLILAAAMFIPGINTHKTSAACDHVWIYEDSYQYNSDYHKKYYYCENCYEEKYNLESHSWNDDYYDYDESNDTHIHYFDCPKCYDEKSVREPHTWKKDDSYSSLIDDIYHETVTSYECEACYKWKDITTKEKHSYAWAKYGSFYFYECKSCEYNLNDEFTYNEVFNKTVKKKGTKTISYRCTKHDAVKSVKVVSGSKIIKIKKKSKSKTTYTTPKKGTGKIQVTMKSGAIYTFKIKVK